MRSHKVLNYESILQVLGETACPFCRFMRNFQTGLLQEPISTLLQEEDDLRIREFISYTAHELVGHWLRSQAVLCMVHGAKFKHGAPPVVVSAIDAIMERCRRQLVEDLARLHSEYLPGAEKWGAGTRSRIMVSQRGLHA